MCFLLSFFLNSAHFLLLLFFSFHFSLETDKYLNNSSQREVVERSSWVEVMKQNKGKSLKSVHFPFDVTSFIQIVSFTSSLFQLFLVDFEKVYNIFSFLLSSSWETRKETEWELKKRASEKWKIQSKSIKLSVKRKKRRDGVEKDKFRLTNKKWRKKKEGEGNSRGIFFFIPLGICWLELCSLSLSLNVMPVLIRGCLFYSSTLLAFVCSSEWNSFRTKGIPYDTFNSRFQAFNSFHSEFFTCAAGGSSCASLCTSCPVLSALRAHPLSSKVFSDLPDNQRTKNKRKDRQSLLLSLLFFFSSSCQRLCHQRLHFWRLMNLKLNYCWQIDHHKNMITSCLHLSCLWKAFFFKIMTKTIL